MNLLYNLSIFAFHTGVWVASLFNDKARKFITGRKEVFQRLSERFKNNHDPVVWVHCASLGEFEQGRPVIEAIKNEYRNFKILVTFFSPSGYEVRKNYAFADLVTYLPMDSAHNAKKFLEIVKPSLAVFVKYEFWHHYTSYLHAAGVPILSVSSIFRKDQLFFKSSGVFYRNILKKFTHFFVQNNESVGLLKSIGLNNITLSGDTRFDRVHQIVSKAERIEIAERFKTNQKVFVLGSAWPEDLEVLSPFINENKLKFIIAPHEIHENSIHQIEKTLTVKTLRYSQAQDQKVEEFSVLIIDNIGMLSRLYRYGEFAFIGGAYGKGLHNILEAACYGIPIMFGNKNYKKFQEAVDLINRGGAFEIKDYTDLKDKYASLNDPATFLLACEVTRQYVNENLGATEKIISYCRPLLNHLSAHHKITE